MKDIILATSALLLLLVAIAIGTSVGSKKPMATPPDVLMSASEPRSPQWPAVRAKWLETHGECAACGQKDNLAVHHVIPFSVDASKELDPTNFLTLCTDGPGHMSCHLVIGHAGSYQCYNEKAREDAANMRAMFEERTCKN